MPALDMPPVTEAHRQHAYILLRPKGISYTAAMTLPENDILRRGIEAKAHQLRTNAWLETQKRTVVPVRRCRPGVDGHPVKWATQLVMGDYAPVHQPDLLNP
jgi:hypothetical protein